MGEFEKDCPKCGTEMTRNKYKDALDLDGWYFTVELVACAECGYVDNEQTCIF